MAIAATERLLQRTDLVRFDGHQAHPLNLSIVLLHDSPIRRLRLAAHAFVAFPEWKRRVGLGTRPRSRVPVRTARPGIAILVTSDRRRGAEVFGERLAAGLRRRGWEVTLLALSTDRAEPRIQASAVVETSKRPLGRLDARVVAGLRKSINRLQPGLILANGSSTLQYAVAATRFMRRPIKLVYSSIGEPLYWIRGRGRRLIQRSLLSQADLVLAVSEATQQQLVGGLGMPEESVVVAPTGVPEAFFAIRKTQRIDGAFRLLFLGNLSREKNPMAALEVARRLMATTPVELRFVGEGPLLARLKKSVTSFGLEHAVAFEGSADDVAPHLSWADLLVLTSETEGLPGVVLEAGAAGLPTVAFEVGGTPETIREGITGELIPPGDITSLTAAIAALASDRGRLEQMGQKAREFVAEHYSLDAAVARYEGILSRQLDATRGGTSSFVGFSSRGAGNKLQSPGEHQ